MKRFLPRLLSIGIDSSGAREGSLSSMRNIVRRFQTLAQPGQVVTGPRTAAWIGDAATIEWLDEVHVKGKSEPVRPSVLGPTVRK